jgi:hypothetical protein
MPREPDPDTVTEPSPDPEWLRAEAARYALLRRLSPALRHEAAAPLQPIAMAASVLEKRLAACEPALLPLRDCVQRLVRYAREAARGGLDLVAWLEPEGAVPAGRDAPPAQRPLGALVEDAFALLATPLGFEGFTLEAPLSAAEAARVMPAAPLRLLLPAGLLWLSDQPGPPGPLVLATEIRAGQSVLRMTRSEGPSPKEKADSLREPAYRRLGLAELQVLARSEGLDLRRQREGPQLTLELALPA